MCERPWVVHGSMLLTLFDQCMAGLYGCMAESMHMSKQNALVGTRVSLTIKKSKRNGYSNYNVTHLDVLHSTACVRAVSD